jgi:hypothetical protein
LSLCSLCQCFCGFPGTEHEIAKNRLSCNRIEQPLLDTHRHEATGSSRSNFKMSSQTNRGAGMRFRPTSELLSGLEGERVTHLSEAARLNGVSIDTLRRQHSNKIVKMSDKRVGMRLKDALSLAQPIA